MKTLYRFAMALVLIHLGTPDMAGAFTSTAVKKEHRVLVHGHRGSRGTHPENTIPAFEEGVSAQADFLELDLHLTSDNIPVVVHDADVSGKLCRDVKGNPLTSGIPIRKLTARDLAAYDCGSIPQSSFPEQKMIPGTRIPTFEELLRWRQIHAPNIGLNVEIKVEAASADLLPETTLFAEKVVSLLSKYGAFPNTIVQSFDMPTIAAVKRLAPTLALSCLYETESNFCELAVKNRCNIVSPNYKLVTAARVAECHAKGVQVVPWTVNQPEDWKNLVALGVDAIISDYPRKLVAFLAKHR